MVVMPETTRTINIDGLNSHLSQLNDKISGAHDYLDKCKSLSETINAGISSLELRKARAADTLHLLTDVVEVRGSVKMVKKSLANAKDSKQLDQLETATYFMQKTMSLMQVIGA